MKEIKNLKINYIDIENFKNIDWISTELFDWNIIWWYNGNWKSSFVEAILTAIQGQKFFWNWKISPASLVKKWENEATIRLWIAWDNNELSLVRTFKKWSIKQPAWKTTLEATMNNQKISQDSLNQLLNTLTLDPLALANLSITEQIKEIKNTTWLDTSEIDEKIKSQEDERKESRYDKDKTETLYNSIKEKNIEKLEEKSLSWLLEDRKIFEKKQEKLWEYQRKKQEIETKQFEISELETKLENWKKQLMTLEINLEVIKTDWLAINEEIKTKWMTTVEDLDLQIQDIENHNSKAKEYQNFLKAKEDFEKSKTRFEKDENLLKKLREQRTEIIANSNLPKYMEISDELWILVDWIEYKLLNTARKIEVAIDLVLISWSPLRMIRIENGWELDVKTLEKIKDKVLSNWFQLFLERPIIDKFDSIIINDWELLIWEDKENFINNQ